MHNAIPSMVQSTGMMWSDDLTWSSDHYCGNSSPVQSDHTDWSILHLTQ